MDSSSLPLRLQSRSAGTTPTSIHPSIRPKAKRSHTGELAPTHTLVSPSTPPHPHSSLLSLLAQTFRVNLTVSHKPSSLVPGVTCTDGPQPEPPRGLPDLVPLPHLTRRLKDLGEEGKENTHHFLSVCVPVTSVVRLTAHMHLAQGYCQEYKIEEGLQRS